MAAFRSRENNHVDRSFLCLSFNFLGNRAKMRKKGAILNVAYKMKLVSLSSEWNSVCKPEVVAAFVVNLTKIASKFILCLIKNIAGAKLDCKLFSRIDQYNLSST